MKREVSLTDISDGKLYTLNDLVKADCLGCKGCHECCTGMGTSLTLDPFDAYLLAFGCDLNFSELFNDKLELNVVDGVVLPNIKMDSDGCDECGFLNEDGRCKIHRFRPSICRIFPLGRFYKDEGFKYFVQKNECKCSKAKIKLSKWIDIPEPVTHDEYVLKWHNLLKYCESMMAEHKDAEYDKKLNMLLLNLFYMSPYDYPVSPARAYEMSEVEYINVCGAFYGQFMDRFNYFINATSGMML